MQATTVRFAPDRPNLWFYHTRFIKPVKDAKENNRDSPRAGRERLRGSITFRVREQPAEE